MQALQPDLEDLRRRVGRLRRRALAGRAVVAAAVVAALAAGVLVPLAALRSIGHGSSVQPRGTPAPSPSPAIFTDAEDGITIQAPSDWRFSTNPVPGVIEPKVDFALGSWDFPTGEGCGPNPALADLPADGVFIWVIEYDAGTVTPGLREDFAPSPQEASFQLEPVQPECANARPSYVLLFHLGDRFFELHAAYGGQMIADEQALVGSVVKSISVQGA